MSQHVIFYFSGTGNSLKAALTIARKLEAESKEYVKKNPDGSDAVTDIDRAVRIVCMGPDEPFIFDGSCETIGFVFPCHFGGVPQRVLEYLQTLDLTLQKNAYIYAVVTYGAAMGSRTLGQLNDALSKKGHPLAYGAAVKAFSTYVILYKMSTELSEKTMLLKDELEPVVADILARRTIAIKQPDLIGKIYRKVASGSDVKNNDRGFVVNDNCTHCGQCVDVCPVNDISLEGEPLRPHWHHHCTQCLSCLHLCPNQAIDFGSKTQGRGRYKHPEITVKMLMAYNHNNPETLEQRY